MNLTLKRISVVLAIILLVVLVIKLVEYSMSSGNITQSVDVSGLSNNLGDTTSMSSTSESSSSSFDKNGINVKAGTSGFTGGSVIVTKVPSDSTLLSLIKNATTIRVPNTGVDIALSQGEGNFVDGAVSGHVSIGNMLGKVSTNDGYDIFVDMFIATAGKFSITHYVALFHNVAQAVAYTSAVSIGDRLVLKNVTLVPSKTLVNKNTTTYLLSSVEYTMDLSYLDRKNGEVDTVTPTVAKDMSLYVKNHIVSK